MAKGRPVGATARPKGDGSSEHSRIKAAFNRVLNPDTLDKIAKAQIAKAIEGDSAAFSFIRDTIDGKPLQRTEASITTNGPLEQLTDAQLQARINVLEQTDKEQDTDQTSKAEQTDKADNQKTRQTDQTSQNRGHIGPGSHGLKFTAALPSAISDSAEPTSH